LQHTVVLRQNSFLRSSIKIQKLPAGFTVSFLFHRHFSGQNGGRFEFFCQNGGRARV
jgi:hypothetical protein